VVRSIKRDGEGVEKRGNIYNGAHQQLKTKKNVRWEKYGMGGLSFASTQLWSNS
jgi:hypothetical protein